MIQACQDELIMKQDGDWVIVARCSMMKNHRRKNHRSRLGLSSFGVKWTSLRSLHNRLLKAAEEAGVDISEFSE